MLHLLVNVAVHPRNAGENGTVPNSLASLLTDGSSGVRVCHSIDNPVVCSGPVSYQHTLVGRVLSHVVPRAISEQRTKRFRSRLFFFLLPTVVGSIRSVGHHQQYRQQTAVMQSSIVRPSRPFCARRPLCRCLPCMSCSLCTRTVRRH